MPAMHAVSSQLRLVNAALFPLTTLLITILCTVLIIANMLQGLPRPLNLAVFAYGAAIYWIHLESRKGRIRVLFFYLATLAVLDTSWFFNAGSQGSVAYFFFAACLIPIIFFEGAAQVSLFLLVPANGCVLLAIEAFSPDHVVPYPTAEARLLDLSTGFIFSTLTAGAFVWAVLLVLKKELAERVSAEEALVQSEERYRALATVTSKVLYRMSPDWSEMYYLNGNRFLAGTESPRTDWMEAYIPPCERELLIGAIRETVEQARPFHLEHRVFRIDGTEGWVNSRAVPLFEEGGKIIEWVGGASDITDRKEHEERIRRQNTLLMGIDRILRASFTASESELRKLCLEVAEKVTGSSYGFIGDIVKDDLLTNVEISQQAVDECRLPSPLDPENPLFPIRGLFGHAVSQSEAFFTNSPSTHPACFGLPDGHPPVAAFLGVPVRDDERVIGVIALAKREGGYDDQDLETMNALSAVAGEAFTRKRAEDSLRESQLRLMLALDGGKMGLCEFDLESREATWSPLEYELMGLPVGDGHPSVETFFSRVHPEDLDLLRSSIGSALKQCRNWEHEFRILLPGGEIRWLMGAGHVLMNAEGKAVKMVGVNYDITERKLIEQELRLAHDTLEHRVLERTVELRALNRELESFCYSVTHELGAPLRGMNCFANILLEEYQDKLDREGVEHLARISSAAGRMGSLIEDLLKLSRVTRRKLVRENVSLSDIACRVADGLSGQAPEREVKIAVPAGIEGEWDPALAELALQNLLGNAWKYTRKTASPKIEFGCLSDRFPVVYYVRDNGIGFDMTYADKIFLPFERLHRAGEYEGTGIGLATVQRVITMHGGKIWAEAEPGQGATFYFTGGC